MLKYFIRYNDNDVIRPVCLSLPQMTGYFKEFNENATMFFRVNNKQLLKHYNKIWRQYSFHNKKIPKEKSSCKCPSLVILDSIIKTNKKYYP